MGEGRQGRVRARTVKPGSFLGHYEILEPLAKGGMAEVFLARDSHGGKLVVLKRGLAEMMEQDDLASMFYDEARLVSMFSHPNIVRTYDARAAAAEHYYVMEYLDGLDCQQLLHRVARAGHSIPLAVSVNLMIRLADALHYAHELCDENGKPLNIVHRDISPGNLRLTLDGQVKLLDFGVAAAALEERTVTRVGQVKGKLTYMAPEQLAGSYDRRSDIFSLGVVLYELSTLTRFFGASKLVVEDRFGFKGAEKPTSIVPDYPPELEAIVMKATASNPAHRYQTAAELGRKLVDFVVANEMRLSDEVLADFIIKLVELEKDPVEEPPPAELTVRASQTGEVTSPRVELGQGSDEFESLRPTVVLETGEEPVVATAQGAEPETSEAEADPDLPTLEEISQRRRQRLRATTSASAAEASLPVQEPPKARRVHWRLLLTLAIAAAAAAIVAEMLIQL